MLFWTIAVRDIQKNRYFLLQIANMEKMQYIYMHYHFENCQLEKKSEIVISYTEILTGKFVLWSFFSSETSEKLHNSTFQVKISV